MRIYDKDNNPLDFCRRCQPTSHRAVELGLIDNASDGEYDADHPPYSETDYKCDKCRRPLTDRD